MKYKGNTCSTTAVEPVSSYGKVYISFTNPNTNHTCDLTVVQARRFALDILDKADRIDSENKEGKK